MDATLQVNLREAKAQLSRLADAAHQGATVVLTKHGRPWARLVLSEPVREVLAIRRSGWWWPRPSWRTCG